MLAKAHPARDLCYFLYVNGDGSFRSLHLDVLLRAYFDVFSSYTNEVKKFQFEDFRLEFEERRDIGLIWGMLVS